MKKWLLVGGILLLGLGALLGLKRKKDLCCAEETEAIIKRIDEKEPEETDPAMDAMTDDVEKAFKDMGLNEEPDDDTE